MKKLVTAAAIIMTASLSFALDLSGTLSDARRMCVNDSIPQALLMLDEQLKGNWSEDQKTLLHLEKGDILLYYARMPLDASKIYEGLVQSNPPKAMGGELYYRLGLAYERSEKFADAARAYEKVVTDYSDSPYNNFALTAIERTFLKNYEIKAAEVNGYPISQLEVEEITSRLSPAEQEQATTPEGRKNLVERIVYERLLKVAAVEKFAPRDSTLVTIHLSCRSCRPKDVMIPGHLSDRDLEKRIAETAKGVYLRRLYSKEVTEKIQITDKDRKQYYKENIERFTIPAKYTTREIVTDSIGMDSVLAALKSGITFDSAAKLYSKVDSRNRGGLMGVMPQQNLPKETLPLVDTIKVGVPSAPFKTNRGWEVMLVESKTEPKVNPYETVISQIDDFVKRQKLVDLSKKAVERFRTEAGIDSVPKGDTLARVAGTLILQADLDSFIADLSKRMPVSNPKDTTFQKQALQQMIQDKVFDLALAQAKLFLEDSLSNNVESNRIQLFVDDYLATEVEKKAMPSDSVMQDYYNKNKKEFFSPLELQVREILFDSEDSLKLAQKLLKEGSPFDSVAKTFSIAPSKDYSGYVGYIEEGKSGKPYERQILKLKENTVSKPIKTAEGYWLIKCEKRQEAYQKSFKDSYSQINSILYEQRKQALEKDLRERLMSSAVITISQAPDAPQPTLEIAPTTTSPVTPVTPVTPTTPVTPVTPPPQAPEPGKDEPKQP